MSTVPSVAGLRLPGLRRIQAYPVSLVQIYLDAVTHQVITSEELPFVAGHQDHFDRTELKLSERLECLISSGRISVGMR